MTTPGTKTTTVDIKVATPLPSSVLLTLSALLHAAYPGAEVATNDEPYRNQVIFRVNNAKRQTVDDKTAAELRLEPENVDLDLMALGPKGVEMLTPEIIGSNFLAVIKSAFERNPDAANYLEFTLNDPQGHHRYLLTFLPFRSADLHELRLPAEKELTAARGKKSTWSVVRARRFPRGCFGGLIRG
jgi:hypothetical protein